MGILFPTFVCIEKEFLNLHTFKQLHSNDGLHHIVIVLTSKGIIFALILALVLIVDANSGEVVVLTKENFNSVVNGNITVVVDFYSGNGYSRVLAPRFAMVAQYMFKKEKPVILGKVDTGTEGGAELARSFGVRDTPTIRFFLVSGLNFEYHGEKDVQGNKRI